MEIKSIVVIIYKVKQREWKNAIFQQKIEVSGIYVKNIPNQLIKNWVFWIH